MIEIADRVVPVASETGFPGTGSPRVHSPDPRTLELGGRAGGKVIIA
ncbi:hypothetical protein GCM10010191_85230 [Actinomadura vinacea]|uniref:Uncharacterized protein n=1 Tax=Actinomadura vinacea TaxID=115336 RepID=A0ABN3KAY0_9ACTN